MTNDATLFITNIPYAVTESELERLFAAVGRVIRVRIPLDRETSRPRGIAFVEMRSALDARRAVDTIDGTDFGGRRLHVKVSDR